MNYRTRTGYQAKTPYQIHLRLRLPIKTTHKIKKMGDYKLYHTRIGKSPSISTKYKKYNFQATYIIRDPQTSMVKIGRSHQPFQRLHCLSYEYGRPFEIEGLVFADIEKQLQFHFRNQNIVPEWAYGLGGKDEWFESSNELEQFITEVFSKDNVKLLNCIVSKHSLNQIHIINQKAALKKAKEKERVVYEGEIQLTDSTPIDDFVKSIVINNIFENLTNYPSPNLSENKFQEYYRSVKKIFQELPGITKLGRTHLKDIFDAYDVWGDIKSARFITYVRVLNSGSEVRQHYHQELINFCVAEPRSSKTLLIAGTVMLEAEGLKDTDRKKMEFVMSLLMGCKVERECRRVKTKEWVEPEEGGELKMVVKSEVVNLLKVSPLSNRQDHVPALRSLRIFGYEPGSVKEVDHDFVEAVEQVKKEIPGFTF